MNETTSSNESTTLEQRLAQVHEDLRAEQTSPEPAPDTAEESPTPPADASSAEPEADSADATPKPPADRAARLAALRAEEQKRQESRQRRSEADKLARELADARRRAEEAEAAAAKRVDLDALDEAAFFRLAQAKGIRPERLGEWIREAMVNPERIAEAAAADAARKAVDPKLSEVEKKLAMLEQQLAAERQQRSLAEQQAAEMRAAQEFSAYVEAASASAPYASAFLRERGGDEFYALALRASEALPPGAGWQAVLDVIEDNLTSFASIYGSKSSKAAKPTPPKLAAAKANTVSAQLAQERASVVDEEDWSSLPFDERVARIKAAR